MNCTWKRTVIGGLALLGNGSGAETLRKLLNFHVFHLGVEERLRIGGLARPENVLLALQNLLDLLGAHILRILECSCQNGSVFGAIFVAIIQLMSFKGAKERTFKNLIEAENALEPDCLISWMILSSFDALKRSAFSSLSPGAAIFAKFKLQIRVSLNF